jgi:ornithine cyclodeaminase/alanine dehydrogenase-like protein (mu-crystallin family)
MTSPLWIDAATIHSALSYPDAVGAVAEAVRAGMGTAPPRQTVDTSTGQILLMPAELEQFAGVKVVTIAPANPERGLPRINGVYVLFDAATLVPIAQLDAPALTAVRTAAVSALAVDRLAPSDASRLVVFGAGPQAHAHVAALAAIRPVRSVDVVARTVANADAVARTAAKLGLAARTVATSDATRVVAAADLVACCTTARAPLFDSTGLPAQATVVAVGSHEPQARELDAALIRRATVVVESRASARTAGDVVLAGEVDDVVAGDLADLLAGRISVEPGRPRVFKSVGEAWEDLAVAAAIYTRVVV